MEHADVLVKKNNVCQAMESEQHWISDMQVYIRILQLFLYINNWYLWS